METTREAAAVAGQARAAQPLQVITTLEPCIRCKDEKNEGRSGDRRDGIERPAPSIDSRGGCARGRQLFAKRAWMMFVARIRERRRARSAPGARVTIMAGSRDRLLARAHERIDEGGWRPTPQRRDSGQAQCPNLRLEPTAGARRGVQPIQSSCSRAPRRATAPAAAQAHVRAMHTLQGREE